MGEEHVRGNVLIVTDKPGWAYDTIAKGLVRYNNNEGLVLDIAAASVDMAFIEREHHRYDLVFPLGWTEIIAKQKKHAYAQRLPFLDRGRLITGIHSHRSWDDYASLPDYTPAPPPALLAELSRLRGINIISRRLYETFRTAGLTNIVLTENGVDTELFRPARPVPTERSAPLIVGFSGSKDIAKHDTLKGFSEFIQPLGSIPNVRVRVLGGRGIDQVKRADMPALYNDIDIYVCASTSEGFSQSVLEAAACARGVLSTRVGGCEDLIEEGRNGYFIPRSLQAIETLVRRLEADRALVARLGENNRRVVLERYAWSIRAADWLRFIESHLAVAPQASNANHL
ncbi:MAG: glycosyltransferase family 4 protein [Burkholderiaceae bacterium]